MPWRFTSGIWLLGVSVGQTEEYAYNPIDGATFPHHPVMRQAEAVVGPFPVESGILTELNGLRVPVHFDCENLCNASQWDAEVRGPSRCPYGGDYRYYHIVPSRWHACHEHEAFLKSGFPHVHLRLPVVDEEYSEMVAVYQSVLRSRESFSVMELGARWATWATRAVALLRLRNPLPYRLFAVEPQRVGCAAAHRVLKLNGMHGQVLCAWADSALFLRLASSIDHLDLLHMDIQSGEEKMLTDPQVLDVLDRKVYRIIVGTHRAEFDDYMVSTFKNWIWVHYHRFASLDCMLRVGLMRDPAGRPVTLPPPGPKAWAQLRAERCFYNSPQGMVSNIDGSFILDNPRFVNRLKAFSLNDTELRIGDLMKPTVP